MTKLSSHAWSKERARRRRETQRRRIVSVAGNLVLMLVEQGERAISAAEELERLLATLEEAEARNSGGSGMLAWLPAVRMVRKEFRNAGLVLEELAALDTDARGRIIVEMAEAARTALDAK